MTDGLLALRDVGLDQLADIGDEGDRQVRAMLEREIRSSSGLLRPWTRHRVRIGGFVVAPAALLTVVGATVAIAAGNISGRQPPGTPSHAAPIAATISPRIAAHYEVLGEVNSSGAAQMPPAVRNSAFVASLVHLWGLNTALAKMVRLSNGLTVWITPGDGAICMIFYPQIYHGAVLSGSCDGVTQALAGTGVSLLGKAPIDVAGMVPNGVSHIQIHEQTGQIVSSLVTDNAYESQVALPVTGISYTGPNGTVKLAVFSYGATISSSG